MPSGNSRLALRTCWVDNSQSCGSEIGKISGLLSTLISVPTELWGRNTNDESSSWDQSRIQLTCTKETGKVLQRHMENRPEQHQATLESGAQPSWQQGHSRMRWVGWYKAVKWDQSQRSTRTSALPGGESRWCCTLLCMQAWQWHATAIPLPSKRGCHVREVTNRTNTQTHSLHWALSMFFKKWRIIF